MLFLAAACFGSGRFAAGQTVTRPGKANLPPADEIWMGAIVNESHNEWRYLRGKAHLQTSEMLISADEIDYNSDTAWAYGRGHVHLEEFSTGDKLEADHGEYNLQTEEGKFYVVAGTAPAKILTSPGVLTTTNPFYFQARWAERIRNRYILHHGYITDCKIPKPWWTFQAPVFDIIPGNRAMARHTVFRLKRVPIFYLPWFYRPLGRNPRRSGFLTPNIGHTTRNGYMFGAGYYWAINRSYDVDYLLQYFTARGPAHTVDFRGKPNEVSDFNFNLYGVEDITGLQLSPGQFEHQGGLEFELTGRTQIWGFNGRLDLNYLSSYLFRQAFSYSFATAISSEVDSVGYLQRHFKDDVYTANVVLQRTQLFESVTLVNLPPNQVVVQRFPLLEFSGRDQQLTKGPLPLWFSFGSSVGAMNKSETLQYPGLVLNTGGVGRLDLEPHVMTAFSFKGFALSPGVTFGATGYTSSYSVNTTTYTAVPAQNCAPYPSCPPAPFTTATLGHGNLFRKDADFTLDLRTPSLERVFAPPKWLHLGSKVKHVIEAEATYEYVTGINEFQRIIHFDATDILSNTNQLTLWLTNRLYKKDKAGNVSEFLTWRIGQARYFDPTFGGAVLPNVRNVVLATEEISPYAFLSGPRNYSPVVSFLSISPYTFIGAEWRADYDPLRHKMIDDTFSVNIRHGQYGFSVSETALTNLPLLVPQANQTSFGASYGSVNRRGWNAAGLITYDVLAGRTLYEFLQASYNTNCCGFSFQIRHLPSYNAHIPAQNQYLFAFSVANLGTFGSLQKQERIQ